MDPALVAELNSLKDDRHAAINTKVGQMQTLLERHGHLYQVAVLPSQLLVHPANRCGMLVNSYDCHEKGFKALSVGFDASKLSESVCFEVAKDPVVKAMQVQSNVKLVAASENRLAPVSSLERYLTVSASHVSQFCKAVASGHCSTEHEVLKGVNNGALTMDSLQSKFKDKVFEQLCYKGWTWKCITAETEQACPWMPAMFQAALNTAGMVAKVPTEVEVALSLCYWHQTHGGSIQQAVETTRLTMPLAYIETVSAYVCEFGGGDNFGLVYLLDQISKMFGSQLFLGEEFLSAITFVDFKDAESRYPFVRAALWACQLHSPKHHDSISRLLSKTDVEKLKTAAVKQTVKNAEQLLKMSWDILEKLGWLTEKKGVGLIARFMIRVALFVCNKSGKGREPHVYESLADVHTAFSQELEAVKKGHDPAKAPGAASSSSAAGSPAKRIKVVSLEASRACTWVYRALRGCIGFLYIGFLKGLGFKV